MKINKYLFLLSLTLISANSFSQLSTNSPYSRFGLGNLSNSVSPEQSAIGGTSVVFCNSEIINSNNPATYSTFKSKSFLFSTSLNASVTDFQTNDMSQTESNTNFSNLSFLKKPFLYRILFLNHFLSFEIHYNFGIIV